MGRQTPGDGTTSEREKHNSSFLKHKPITYHGRSYNFDSNCSCAGCESLRVYPEPSKCDWCKQTHCGGPEHCSTEERGSGSDVLGASETDSSVPEGYLEDVCGIIRDRIGLITQTVKEIAEEMIPRYQGATTEEVQTAPSRGNSRGRGRGNRERDGHNFLKWEEIGNGTKPGKILAVKVQPDNFDKSQTCVMCKVSVDGQIRLYALRINNPNLETLQNAWGFDENDWVDKKVTWSVEEDDLTGRHNIRVDPAEEQKKGRKS